jgi:integrase/recombinase XerD
VLTIEEVERTLSIPNTNKPLGVRDRAILETLYSTGMRRSELAVLKIYDLDLDLDLVQLTVRVFGKGKKERMIPIGSRAVEWVEKYLTVVRPWLVRAPDPGHVFLKTNGQSLMPDYLTTEIVKPYIKQAGIEKKGSCHLFRHAMATHMLNNGANLRSIQQILGHKKLSTTGKYTLIAIEKLKEIHAARHPGASYAAVDQSKDLLLNSEPELDEDDGMLGMDEELFGRAEKEGSE